MPCESTGSSLGSGISLVSRLCTEGRDRCLSLRQDPSDRAVLLLYDVAGCPFLLRLVGTSLSAAALCVLQQGVETAIAEGRVESDPLPSWI